MATFHVVCTEGAQRFYKQLCAVHVASLRADAKAGRLVWPKPPAPPTVGLLRPGAAAPTVPAAPAPLVPPPERPRIRFEFPANPLVVVCKSCGAKMVWINFPKTKSVMPVNYDGERRGESHFATCPDAAKHRKPR